MIKGLYAAASAMLANLSRQNDITHNLANIDTPGFRQILSSLEDFRDTTVRTMPDQPLTERPTLIGQLGLGVENAATQSDFAQGPLESTGQPLDFAIMGAGFFRVNTPDGERYTRDGRFLRDAAGTLVTVDGYQVLNAAGAAMTVPDGTVAAAADGTLTVDGQAIGQLGLAAFTDPKVDLTRDPAAGNLFVAANAPAGTTPGSVLQGHLEMSNVDAAQAMTQMVAVGRAYEAAQRLVQANDTLLGQSIQSLGTW